MSTKAKQVQQAQEKLPEQAQFERIFFSKAQLRRLRELNREVAMAQKELQGYINYLADEHEIDTDGTWSLTDVGFQRAPKENPPSAMYRNGDGDEFADVGVAGDGQLMQE